jgi:cytoskeletal protein CcmA (bactofilin family)
MSGNPLFAPLHTGDEGDERKITSSATALKSALEWGQLVGFRRNYSAVIKNEAPEPVVNAVEGIVVVGKGASIVGEISNCSQVEIAGALEGKVVAAVVIVREGGWLKGQVYSDRAEVHGTIEGQIQVEDHLDIRATGDVSGELTYGKLSVASGGRLAGCVEIGAHARARAAAAEQARGGSSRDGTVEAFPAPSYV